MRRLLSRLPFLVALVLLATLLPVDTTNAQTVPYVRPNILVIVTDDQRFDQMAAMPFTQELFAAGGTAFANAYAETPLCCPSRASIFSGQYTHNHKVTGNTFAEVGRLDLTHTIQRALHNAGYQTGMAGKIFNGWDINRPPPDFDHFATTRGGYQTTFNVDGNLVNTADSTQFVSDQASSILAQFQQHPDKPWFLYVAPFAPHFPYVANGADATADVGAMKTDASFMEADKSDKPPWIRDWKGPDLGRGPRDVWGLQSRSLLAVDRMVKRLFDANPKANDTIAIFVSDNGYMLGEHGISEDKRLPYTPSIHVPMFMRWPGRVMAGRTDQRYALNVDIAPTLLHASRTNAAAMPRLDGYSLLGGHVRRFAFVEGYATKENPSDAGFPAWSSVVGPQYQYTEWRGPKDGVAFRELYDQQADPFQLRNMVVEKPAIAATKVGPLANVLKKARACHGTTGDTACP